MIRIFYGPPRTMLQHVLENVTSTLHWVTADGRRIAVGKMDDQHLISTVRKLRRDATGMLLEENGDEKECGAGITREEYLLARVRPYSAMLAELAKRGLVKQAADIMEPVRRRQEVRTLSQLLRVTRPLDEFPDLWGPEDMGWRR